MALSESLRRSNLTRTRRRTMSELETTVTIKAIRSSVEKFASITISEFRIPGVHEASAKLADGENTIKDKRIIPTPIISMELKSSNPSSCSSDAKPNSFTTDHRFGDIMSQSSSFLELVQSSTVFLKSQPAVSTKPGFSPTLLKSQKNLSSYSLHLFCVLLRFVSFGSGRRPCMFMFVNFTWKSRRVTEDEDVLTAMVVTEIVMFATKRF
ncbi:unnamed protein product [Caenorhabditis nigoni]